MSKDQVATNLGNVSSNLRRIALWLANPNRHLLKNRIDQIGQSVIETLSKTQIPLSKFHPYNQLLQRLKQDFNSMEEEGKMIDTDPKTSAEKVLYLSVRLSNLSQLLVR